MNSRVLLVDDRKQIFQGNAKNPREIEQLEVAYPNHSRLDLRDGATSDIPADELQLDRQHVLGPIHSVSQLSDLRANQVEVPHIAPVQRQEQ